MALIIPVGFGQAVYEMRLVTDPDPIVTTMGHDLSNVEGGDYDTIADRLFNSFHDAWSPIINSAYELTQVTLYVGQDGGPPAVVESTETAVAFTGSSPALPQNCAALVRKRTSAAGRRGRGRCYIPGIREDKVEATGVYLDGYEATLQAAADQWMDWLDGTEPGSTAYPPVILHRSEGAGTEPPPTPVTAFEVDSLIATQRRRLRK